MNAKPENSAPSPLCAPQQWPADKVERRPIGDLVPAARNARTHTTEQVGQLMASLMEFGWTSPVLVDEEGVLIAGHGRILAAQGLGWPEVPVMVAAGWTDAQKRAYAILDNRVPMNAGWDDAILAAELDALRDLKFDLSLMGFAPGELNDLIGTPNTGPPGIDEATRTLAERFMIPPFSVLNAREGWWQDRKRAWLALGIKSEIGRGDDAGMGSKTALHDSSEFALPLERQKLQRYKAGRASPGGQRAQRQTTAKGSAVTGAGGR